MKTKRTAHTSLRRLSKGLTLSLLLAPLSLTLPGLLPISPALAEAGKGNSPSRAMVDFSTGLITAPNGTKIGYISGTGSNRKAVDLNGAPLKNTQLMSTDGKVWDTDGDGNLSNTNSNQNSNNQSNPSIPNLPSLQNPSSNSNGNSNSSSLGSSSNTGGIGSGLGNRANSGRMNSMDEFASADKQADPANIKTSTAYVISPQGRQSAGSPGKTNILPNKSTSGQPSRLSRTGTPSLPGVDGNGKESDYISLFNGFDSAKTGVRGSSIVMDHYLIQNSYPQLFVDPSDSKRPSLASEFGQRGPKSPPINDIGTDDEYLKSSLAINQPITRLQKDFLESTDQRDRYLDAALSLRGIAIMTMGFLDKTVGAGLTAIQQQADMNTSQQLQKQISWTTSKLANPDRAQYYRDQDEKVEACLYEALSGGSLTQQIPTNRQQNKLVDFTCDPSCGQPPSSNNKYRSPVNKTQGNGTYDYCVCCAETATKLNKLTQDVSESTNGVKWSLAERVLRGTKGLRGGGDSQMGTRINTMIERFKDFYGDVILQEQPGKGGGDPYIRTAYIFPRYSVKRIVAAFKNGCRVCDNPETCNLDDIATPTQCNILQDFGLTYGICPALSYVLENWSKIKQNGTAGYEDALEEASLGFELTAANYEALLALKSSINGNKIDGSYRRVVRNLCETSAVAAANRLHSKMAAIVSDHLRLNQYASSADKAKLADLLSRTAEQLSLAESDIHSSYMVEDILASVDSSKSRQDLANMGAVTASNAATQSMQALRGGNLLSWGSMATQNFNAGATAGPPGASDLGISTANIARSNGGDAIDRFVATIK